MSFGDYNLNKMVKLSQHLNDELQVEYAYPNFTNIFVKLFHKNPVVQFYILFYIIRKLIHHN